ncbi:MAG: LON peptidase substrate-binding domain-containing protein [Acidobacteria bacterium]|nr:LON peptidase substrate-binding domain-containing protein [Acidobacteriota bacterium]
MMTSDADVADGLLPIFPLAVVLVPGELLPLHIFEERYKALMKAALEGSRIFGLSFVDNAEVGVDTLPAIGSVGCEAQISAVVPVGEGRMNLLSVGTGRYVIRGYEQTEPFLLARVERFSDAESASPDLPRLAERVREQFGRLAAAARTLASDASEFDPPDLDAEPEMVSFLVAANLAIENAAKQEMLEMTDTLHRLDLLDERLHRMVEAFEYRAAMAGLSKGNGHGKKLPAVDG